MININSLGEVIDKDGEVISGNFSWEEFEASIPENYRYLLEEDENHPLIDFYREKCHANKLLNTLEGFGASFILTLWNLQKLNNEFTRFYGSWDGSHGKIVLSFEYALASGEERPYIDTLLKDFGATESMMTDDNGDGKSQWEVQIPVMEKVTYGNAYILQSEVEREFRPFFNKVGIAVV